MMHLLLVVLEVGCLAAGRADDKCGCCQKQMWLLLHSWCLTVAVSVYETCSVARRCSCLSACPDHMLQLFLLIKSQVIFFFEVHPVAFSTELIL